MAYFKLGMDKKVIVPYADYLQAMKPDFEFIGDRDEILDTVRCLFLPNANSVKLVAPKGVGITSLMDGLVRHQQDDEMPDEMMVRPIFKLNSNNLFNTADTKTIETRFHTALDELKKYARQRMVKPILVIDDGMNFADNAPQHVINALVEATVTADYADMIIGVDARREDEFDSKHPEFRNSLTTKVLSEPKEDRIMEILRHHAKQHEAQGVMIQDQTLRHVIDITQRFKSMYDTAQPNRAIRLLNAAATAFRLDIHSRPPGVRQKEEDLAKIQRQLDETGDTATAEIRETLETKAETLRLEIDASYTDWNAHREQIKSRQNDIREFDIMIAEAEREIEKLDEQTKSATLDQIRRHLGELPGNHADFKGRPKAEVLQMDDNTLLKFAGFDLNTYRNPKVRDLKSKINKWLQTVEKKHQELSDISKEMHVTAEMPASMVDKLAEQETKTPVGGIHGRLRENLRNGTALMQESVFGQDHVIQPVIQSLQRAAAGLNDPNRPLGAFMISGPPGVGKSFIGKQLAIKLFGSADYFSQIDMENYQEKHTVSSLIGAPPGYAGYGKKGKLIDIGQNKPFGVLLLDEIEKAHPDIRQALLKMKGSGRLVGLDSEEADFRNIIIIETTNYGQDIWINNDFQSAQKLVLDRMRQDTATFSPEYLDRNDAILCAGPLDTQALSNIVEREIKSLETKTKRAHPDLKIQVEREDIQAFVADHCIGKSGRRAEMEINRIIGNELTDIILSDNEASGVFTAQYDTQSQSFGFELKDQATYTPQAIQAASLPRQPFTIEGAA